MAHELTDCGCAEASMGRASSGASSAIAQLRQGSGQSQPITVPGTGATRASSMAAAASPALCKPRPMSALEGAWLHAWEASVMGLSGGSVQARRFRVGV